MIRNLKKYIIIKFVLVSFLSAMDINENIVNVIVNNLILERGTLEHSIRSVRVDTTNNIKNFYVVDLNPQGFVLVSANTYFVPIIGYSFTHSLSFNNLPIQLQHIMNSYRENIFYDISNNLNVNDRIFNLWNKYTNNIEEDRDLREVTPLITANWNQGGAWNNMCPGNSLVGCVAVAMGQVIYYWHHPLQGSGYSSYYHQQYGPISVNFEDYTYDFSSMEDNNATEASQLLLYHAGVSVEMNYSEWGSGASVCWEGPSSQDALINNFNFIDETVCNTKINYDDEGWVALIEEQLDNGWPIIYRAYGENDGPGHAWNVDGYQDGGYLHCNWGWGGSSNGYFYFNNLSGGGFNFVESQAVLINIFPQGINNPMALFEYQIEDMQVNFVDLSEQINENEIISWNWNFGDNAWTSTNQSPVFTYNEYGQYEVSLIVTDNYGLDSDPFYESVNVLNLTYDLNGDLFINVLDIVYLIDLILFDNQVFEGEADLNQDGNLSILDIILLVSFILDN